MMIWFTLIVLVALIAALSFKQPEYRPFEGERISDNYKRDSVKSYEVFQTGIADHVFMMVTLKTGEHFPMLCQKTMGGIKVIHQSVFVSSGTDRWSILCEPNFMLMQINVSNTARSMVVGDVELKRSEPLPQLL